MNLIKTKQSILAEFPTCYACESPKTSMEHAPPRCFFPEATDEKGNCLFRKNLIKVPACDQHNTEKSGDDTYAVWHIAGLKGVNHCGELVHGKLHRMAQHDRDKRNGAFIKRLMGEAIGVSADGDLAGRLDAERMQRFLCSAARALYFYETFKKLTVPLRVTNLSNCYQGPELIKKLLKREAFFESEMNSAPILGANPEVFSYSIQEKAEGIILVQMTFYGTLKHWAVFNPALSDSTASAKSY